MGSKLEPIMFIMGLNANNGSFHDAGAICGQVALRVLNLGNESFKIRKNSHNAPHPSWVGLLSQLRIKLDNDYKEAEWVGNRTIRLITTSLLPVSVWNTPFANKYNGIVEHLHERTLKNSILHSQTGGIQLDNPLTGA